MLDGGIDIRDHRIRPSGVNWCEEPEVTRAHSNSIMKKPRITA